MTLILGVAHTATQSASTSPAFTLLAATSGDPIADPIELATIEYLDNVDQHRTTRSFMRTHAGDRE